MTRLHAGPSRTHSVRRLCRLFGVSRQAFYKRQSDDFSWLAVEQVVVDFASEERLKNPGIGGEKLWIRYNSCSGSPLGRDRFLHILGKYGLNLRLRRRRHPQTTDSSHTYPRYPNLVKDLIPSRPNRQWVSDITYITLRDGPTGEDTSFCYLSLITDNYTKEIIGYGLGRTLEAIHAIHALEMALERVEGTEEGQLIHHSDRGVQYACYSYTDLLHRHGIRISMTQSGDPKDNPVAERVNGIIKNEILGGRRFTSMEEARGAISHAIRYYNNERPHRSLDMMTPAQAAGCTGEVKKRWVSDREKHIKAQSV